MDIANLIETFFFIKDMFSVSKLLEGVKLRNKSAFSVKMRTKGQIKFTVKVKPPTFFPFNMMNFELSRAVNVLQWHSRRLKKKNLCIFSLWQKEHYHDPDYGATNFTLTLPVDPVTLGPRISQFWLLKSFEHILVKLQSYVNLNTTWDDIKYNGQWN